jgi:hypothetical protein
MQWNNGFDVIKTHLLRDKLSLTPSAPMEPYKASGRGAYVLPCPRGLQCLAPRRPAKGCSPECPYDELLPELV